MGSLTNSELLDFTGGLSTVIAPHLIRRNEGRNFVNIDITYGSLKSMPALTLVQKSPYAYAYEFRGKLIQYGVWRSNAELGSKLYWSDGVNTGKILEDYTELPLGMDAPTTAPSVAVQGVPGDGNLHGNLRYCYTFYDSVTGTEGAPSLLTPSVAVDNQDVVISGFETAPAQADSYRIYRVGGWLTRFTLVDTIPATETEYYDSLTERDVDGRLLETLNNGAPPPGIQNFVEYGGRLFGSVGSKVYYSATGNGDSWYVYDWFEMPGTVVALAKTTRGVLIMGEQFVSLLEGYSPETFRLRSISSKIGCVSAKSVAYIQGAPIWLGQDSFYMFDGRLVNITYKRIAEITDIDPSSAIVHNDVYYLAFAPTMKPSENLYPSNDLFPGTVQGSGLNNLADGIIYIDFKRGAGFSYGARTYKNPISVFIWKNKPYLTTFYQLELLPCNEVIDCNKVFCEGSFYINRMDVVLGNRYKKLSYLSPRLIDGSYSTLKEYDKVRINFIGQFVVKVIFDDNTVAVQEFISSKKTLADSQEDIEDMKDELAIIGIPNSNNKSKSIAFEVEGVGIIKSIQYSWKPRDIA